jgi:hypothetical protein
MLASTRNRMGEKCLKRATRGAWAPTSYVLRDIKTGVEDRSGWRYVGATAKTSTLSHEMAVSLCPELVRRVTGAFGGDQWQTPSAEHRRATRCQWRNQDGNTDVATRPTQLRWGVVGC